LINRRHFTNDRDFIMGNVDIIPSGCWEWRGALTQGYGRLWVEGKLQRAHRFVYTVFVGDIPEGLRVCHHCDNPRCVNPECLFPGTDKDNMMNSASKRRMSKCKLSQDQCDEIRALSKQGWTQAALGVKFGVTAAAISNVLNGKAYPGEGPVMPTYNKRPSPYTPAILASSQMGIPKVQIKYMFGINQYQLDKILRQAT
jgi:hypothetical protein